MSERALLMTAANRNLRPTVEQLIARAKEIAPTLVARQAQTEARGYYAEDTHEAFKAAGFYRTLVPPEFRAGLPGFGVAAFSWSLSLHKRLPAL